MNESIKADRAKHIVRSAQEVFFKAGYANATVSDICKTADCSRTTLYSYFETKENVYLAVVNEAFKHFLRYFAELEIEAQTGLERVLAFASGYINYSKSAALHYQAIVDFYGILRNIYDTTAQSDAYHNIKEGLYFERVKTISQIPFTLLKEEIKIGQRDGSIGRQHSAEDHMITIWAYLKGITDIAPSMAHIGVATESYDDLEETATAVVRSILNR